MQHVIAVVALMLSIALPASAQKQYTRLEYIAQWDKNDVTLQSLSKAHAVCHVERSETSLRVYMRFFVALRMTKQRFVIDKKRKTRK